MNGNKNLFLAFALGLLVFAVWQYFVNIPAMKADQARQATLAHQEKKNPALGAPGNIPVPGTGTASGHMTRDAALKAGGQRVAIDTPMLDGSIQLKGAKLDDLRLKKYHETVNPKSPEIVLLAPKSTAYPYYAEFGWAQEGKTQILPDDQSVWVQQGTGTLSPGHPVTLTWDNGHGLVFTRTIAVDDKYMFSVNDAVANKSGATATLYPFAYVAREGVPQTQASIYVHEGFIGVKDGSETDANYETPGCVLLVLFCEKIPPVNFSSTGGWLGITDKYWMAAVVPPQNENFDGAYLGSTTSAGVKAYQAYYHLGAHNIASGTSVQITHRLFAGAKVVDILKGYESKQGIANFDQAVDWGILFFLTRPFFWILDNLNKLFGNFGLAILGLTVLVKLVMFPLANTQFRSMAKMKKLQPEVERVKKVHEGDAQKQQQAMMELYKREKVNPLTGCLPMLMTIPVFMALLKELYVSIEMRQAPFYGWIHDLSAPDPTSILNLFGLLPYHIPAFVPAFLSIGIWPILMGFTQFLQSKLNPAPADPVQAKMFTYMPLIFTFMFAGLPAGLVIYYTWNNLLTVLQQTLIMRRQGVEIHLFENFKRKPK